MFWRIACSELETSGYTAGFAHAHESSANDTLAIVVRSIAKDRCTSQLRDSLIEDWLQETHGQLIFILVGHWAFCR